ncbi:branched-chain amino acid ABC transporter permease [Desulfotalea psychrophila]|uniref:Probable high-affinity branched-chain amino acid ABC transporter, permease protein n=1 Tax=Desulfotalea psychrophila (strain LSv54 / DSM 12343) TaxID=177439 RepID=Q6ANS6_DESPS|nr:branched-chain amino acid ABC transporter permease [Desulfotalea psychrophila]CAG35998.1 probable high-affinity branched-chain amino acid ABC transporter, permease protein [Desulfotalea psychrophila LSv54]
MKNNISLFLFVIVIVGLHLLTASTGSLYLLTQLTMSAYYSLLAIGLCLLMGHAGQISMGHAGFFAIGGYLSASLTTHNMVSSAETGWVQGLSSLGLLHAGEDMFGDALLVLAPWPACLMAIAVAALVALLLGIPILKLKGHYLAMATLGFGIIVYRLVLATEFFGEADGISDVPAFAILPGLSIVGDLDVRVENYYIAAVILFFGFVLLRNLTRSRVGRALRAIHSAEDAADSMGINVAHYKLITFVLSAVFAAFAGVCLTHYNGGIGPSEAGMMKSVRYVAIVAVGGMANLWGVLTMSMVLNYLSLRGIFGSYDDAVFGTVLVLVMLFAPDGIFSIKLRAGLAQLRAKYGEDLS